MKTAFMIAVVLVGTFWAAYFLVNIPEPEDPMIPIGHQYCKEYYNSDPDISIEDDCNV